MKKIIDLENNSLIKVDGSRMYVITKQYEEGNAVLQSEDGTSVINLPLDTEVEVVAEIHKVPVRGFEPVLAPFAKYVEVKEDGTYEYQLPVRKTAKSAGYDFVAPADIVLEPHKVTIVFTNIKAYMLDDEELLISIRSGLSTKGIMMMNSPGKIDADYYGNPNNDGNIGFIFYNFNDTAYVIKKGDAIGQGTFSKYLKADNDAATGERVGGMGSTGR
jgi:dUTP pyrophosphatase